MLRAALAWVVMVLVVVGSQLGSPAALASSAEQWIAGPSAHLDHPLAWALDDEVVEATESSEEEPESSPEDGPEPAVRGACPPACRVERQVAVVCSATPRGPEAVRASRVFLPFAARGPPLV